MLHEAAVTDSDNGEAAAAVPPERPGTMAEQSLTRYDRSARRRTARGFARVAGALRRCLVLLAASLIAGFAIDEMWRVLSLGGITPLEGVVLLLFSVNMTWISLPAVTGLIGMVRLLVRRKQVRPGRPLCSRTAIVMPLYNEDAARAAAAIEAMAREIIGQGASGAFHIFILSDSTDGDIALAEEEVFVGLRQRLGRSIAIYYRRRMRNTAHKSGNIAEFCARWGSGYDHFIVLDADSLMTGETLVELVRRMEDDQDVGLIQTVPRLHEGRTPIAQLQQFAASVYGPALAAGLAWWTGGEGNYWGHNAIIRCRAFMAAAGLPKLAGKPPLGGFILSHDFVEAALLRRAGWTVVIADDLAGSYESSPATLIELALRDRRWCQGNLQHARVILAKGLHWVSRFHLATGMMTFLSSPLWLLFLLATLALGVQSQLARPEYFSRSYTLFPLWPHLDPVRALHLFFVTLGILLVPKLFGFLQFVASPRRLRAAGLAFPLSLALELCLSALLAPVLMLTHCGFIAAILGGSDGGWQPQRRGGNGRPWREVAYRHRWHVLTGCALAGTARFISWQMLAWLAPAVAGMVMAVPLALVTGSRRVGAWLARLGLLRTPLEACPPEVRKRAEAALAHYRALVAAAPDLAAVVGDSDRLRRHLALVDHASGQLDPPFDPLEATAHLKVRVARTLEDAVSDMTAQERAFVQAAPDLLRHLAGLPAHRSCPGKTP